MSKNAWEQIRHENKSKEIAIVADLDRLRVLNNSDSNIWAQPLQIVLCKSLQKTSGS